MWTMLNRKIATGRTGSQRIPLFALSILILQLSPMPAPAQDYGQHTKERKVIVRIAPDYPQTLKRLYIGGIVRVEILIAPNGLVEKTTLLGGNPVLGQSAMKAVKKWRYAPARSAETLTVTLEFDPHV
jgi:TonB family protein